MYSEIQYINIQCIFAHGSYILGLLAFKKEKNLKFLLKVNISIDLLYQYLDIVYLQILRGTGMDNVSFALFLIELSRQAEPVQIFQIIEILINKGIL